MAIVIGGAVVTVHKIKAAVSGGRLQITRCSKYGCHMLFTELQKNRR